MTIGGVEDVIELYRDVSEYNSAFNHDASDSMKYLGQGELPPPASCFVCGSGNDEAGYLSFGIWAEEVGNLLICSSCLVKGAEKLGCLAPSVRTLFEKNIGQLQEHAKGLELKVGELDERNSALLTIVQSGNILDADISPVTAYYKQESEGASSAPDVTSDSEGRDNSDSDESSNLSGPVLVPEPTKSDRYGDDEPLLRL